MIGLIAPESAERADLAAQLGERGHEIVVSDPSAASMQTLVLSQGIEAIVFDLAAADALKLIRRHAAQWKRVPLICLADRRRPNATSDALRLGAADIVARPLRVADVRTALSNAAQLAGLPPDDVPEKPQRPEEEPPDGLFGISPSMQDVMALVQRIAPSGCNVIVIG
jgi:DNA-binding NtrC family response regulator